MSPVRSAIQKTVRESAMPLLSFRRLLRRLTNRWTAKWTKQLWRRCRSLWLERLECRVAPATVSWINGAGGDWNTAGNWDSGKLPGSGDDVVINQTGITITHAAASDTIHSLTSQADLRLTAGTLSVAAASTLNGAFALEGGTVTGTGDLTVNGTFRWSSGTMSGKATTTAQGGLALGDGLKVLDGRTLNVPGPLTWTGGDVVLQNGATWGVPPNQSGLAPYAVLQVSNVTAPALTVGEYVPVTVT